MRFLLYFGDLHGAAHEQGGVEHAEDHGNMSDDKEHCDEGGMQFELRLVIAVLSNHTQSHHHCPEQERLP